MDLDTIQALFEDELDSWAATTDIVFDNVRNDDVPQEGESWVRFTINWLSSDNIALGTRTMRTGIATMQIFTPLNEGPRVAAKIADAYFQLLENRQFGGVWTFAGTPTRLGDNGDGWYQLNADINFQAV